MNDELDKLARDVNNRKKSNNTINNYSKNIDAYLTNQYDKDTNIEPKINGYFSAQGDYSKIDDNDTENKSIEFSELPSVLSSDISDYSFDNNKEILDDNIDLDYEIKKKSKFKVNKDSIRKTCHDFDINSVDSIESLDSGESLIKHIKYCIECKNKVYDLVKKHKTKSKNKIVSKKIENNNYDITEIIIIVLIGIVIIFILDYLLS